MSRYKGAYVISYHGVLCHDYCGIPNDYAEAQPGGGFLEQYFNNWKQGSGGCPQPLRNFKYFNLLLSKLNYETIEITQK